MSDNITIFSNGALNVKVSAIMNGDNEPMFNAGDIALALWKPKDVRKGVARPQMNKLNRALERTDNEGGTNSSPIKKGDYIDESQLYMAIIRSNSKFAHEFQMWVTKDVLPSIRKHGTYISDEATDDQILMAQENSIIEMANAGKRFTRRLRLLAYDNDIDKFNSSIKYIYSKIKPNKRKRSLDILIRSIEDIQTKYRIDTKSENFSTSIYDGYTRVLCNLERQRKNHHNRSNGRLISKKNKQISELKKIVG